MVEEEKGYGKGYGKRPLWQWMLIYVVIGALFTRPFTTFSWPNAVGTTI